MNKNVFEHYTVLRQLHEYCVTNAAKFTNFSLIVALFALIEVNRLILHELGVDQGEKTKGYAANKLIYKNSLAETISYLAGPMAAHYKDEATKDMILYYQLNFELSALKRMRPEKLLQVADSVKKVWTNHKSDLTDTGLKAADFIELDEKVALFEPYADLPNSKKKSKSLVTKKINATIKIAFSIIYTQLSKAMLAIKKIDRPLFEEYEKILEITNEGVHSHINPIAMAPYTLYTLDDATGLAFAGVNIKLVDTKGSYITDADGKLICNLALGPYMGKATAIDCDLLKFVFDLTSEGFVQTIRMKSSLT